METGHRRGGRRAGARRVATPDDVLWSDAGSYFHALEPIAARVRSSDGLWVRRVERHDAAVDASADVRAPRRRSADVRRSAERRRDAGRVRDRARRRRRSASASITTSSCPGETGAMDKDCIAPAGFVAQESPAGSGAALVSRPQGRVRLSPPTRRQEIGVRCKCDRWFYQYIGFHVPGAACTPGAASIDRDQLRPHTTTSITTGGRRSSSAARCRTSARRSR